MQSQEILTVRRMSVTIQVCAYVADKGGKKFMPHKNKTGRAANGSGSIRKREVTRNGKPYTYWEGRVTVE